MTERNARPVEMASNTFGKLVQAYRKERGWSQQELAQRWGYTREYVSQVESGKRKLTQTDQVTRLADILEIPLEHLEAIGRGIQGSAKQPVDAREADDFLLQTLLEPAQYAVKMSWLVWYGNHDTTSLENLTHLIERLEYAIANRRGLYLQPAQELLAYAHEMQGKVAFDRLDFSMANGHFQEMLELGEELHNLNIIGLAMMHQGDTLRRRGRFEHAIKCLEAADKYATAGSKSTNGLRWQQLARAYAEYGHKSAFELAINEAEQVARSLDPNDLDATSNQFNLIDVIQERAQGYTLLGEPRKALDIYRESERLKSFRPMRELGVFIILQAQAHAYAGDVDAGVSLALQGLRLARGYNSKRHISRVQRMYDRLAVTPLGKEKRLQELRQALA